jgi:hypothetical protein
LKFNKAIAGYHMLMILSEVDGHFDTYEKRLIGEYIKFSFPVPINLDTENQALASLPRELYMEHFLKVANDFYWDSSPAERNLFIKFAYTLARADRKISREENRFIEALFIQWDISAEDE